MARAGQVSQVVPVGTRVGRWTVVGGPFRRATSGRSRGHYYQRCRCDCGTERDVAAGQLFYSKTRSCGCIYRAAALQRFWRHVRPLPNGCWLWMGGRDLYGYASFSDDDGRHYGGHRWAYLNFIGPIPDGLHLDHFVCRNRACVNPNHVEPVTIRENLIRGERRNQHMGKTHCKWGHELTPENTTVDRKGHRWCRECKRRLCRAQKERMRAGIPPAQRGKLTAAQVIEIRSRFAAGGVRPHALAKEFGVYQSTIAHIVNGRTWKDLLEPAE